MTGDRVGEVVDFSQVQTQDEAHDSLISTDWAHAGITAASNIPVVGPFVGLFVSVKGNQDAFQEFFSGEWNRENITTVALTAIDVLEGMTGVIGDGLQGVQVDLNMAVNALFKFGLDWVTSSVQPVQDLYGFVIGNPGRLKTAGSMWRGVSENLHALAEGYRSAAADLVQPAWEGYSNTGAMTRTNEYLDALQTTRDLAWTLGILVESMADLSQRLIDFVNQIQADIVAVILDACEDIAKYGYGALLTVGTNVVVIATQYSLRCVAVTIRAVHAFGTGSELCRRLEDVFEDMVDLLDLLTGGSTATAS